jgi:hypothetical protein
MGARVALKVSASEFSAYTSTASGKSNAPDDEEWEDYDFLSLNVDSRVVEVDAGIKAPPGFNETASTVDGTLKSGRR